MKIFGELGETNIVAIGIFDGVHLGHQAIIATAVKAKENRKSPKLVALTFDPHPTAILAPEKEPLRLTTLEDRVQLLLSAGADAVAVIKFDRDFANLTPSEFIEDILIDKLAASEVVVGENFTFGNKAAGSAKDLASVLPTHVVPLVESGGDVISSTRIRNLLIAGEVTQAHQLLGRRFTLSGEVIHGEARGRKIGYPTANLKAATNIQATLLKSRSKLVRGTLLQLAISTWCNSRRYLPFHVQHRPDRPDPDSCRKHRSRKGDPSLKALWSRFA